MLRNWAKGMLMFVHTRTRFKQYKNKFLCLVTFLISYLEAGLAFCLPPAAQQTFHSPNIFPAKDAGVLRFCRSTTYDGRTFFFLLIFV